MTTLMIVDSPRNGESRSQVIARRIRGELGQLDLSMMKAAALCGFKQQWFSRRMTGHVDFTVNELDVICTCLGLSFEYILTGIRALPTGPGQGLLLPRVDSNHEPAGEYLEHVSPALDVA
jgi:hypothetical protein